jgi:hypothetical protein
VCFRTSAACQRTVYTARMKSGASIDLLGKTALNKWQADNPHEKVKCIDRRVQVEPIANACSTARATIRRMLDDMGTDKYELFLTGSDNFRTERATIQPYKGNRDTMDRPVLLPEVREYLVKNWGAEIINGEEADDAIGKRMTAPHPASVTPVSCSMDKDLDMLPGAHYNWTKTLYYEVSETEGWRNFFKQMLTGDDTDNIPGLAKVGPKTAEKLLKGYTKPETMWSGVFQAWFNRYGLRFNEHLSLKEALQEISDLLWIRRYNQERWLVPE